MPLVTGPAITSLPTAALRGSSPGAAQIVVQTAHAVAEVGVVLPDGTFCVDVPLSASELNPLKIFAVGGGKSSAPVLLDVVQTAGGPAPVNGTCATANGGGGSRCSDAQTAACDPRCNGCPEDAYQPNYTPTQAPAITLKGSYGNLQLCPCLDDWFTFVLFGGQHITVQATYQKRADFDLDLGLYRGADVLPQVTNAPTLIATTAGTSGDQATRTLDFTATQGGAYYLQVTATALQVSVSAGARAHGSYSLTTSSP
jgi:hypothetical protein